MKVWTPARALCDTADGIRGRVGPHRWTYQCRTKIAGVWVADPVHCSNCRRRQPDHLKEKP